MSSETNPFAVLVVGLPIAALTLTSSQVGDPSPDQALQSLNAVLELPLPAESDTGARDALARRQAEAAVALARAVAWEQQ